MILLVSETANYAEEGTVSSPSACFRYSLYINDNKSITLDEEGFWPSIPLTWSTYHAPA